MERLANLTTPQLRRLHSGKVRESFRVSDHVRMIVVTDRISCFDNVLVTMIPGKGAVLNRLSNFWFNQTKSICDSHFVEEIDPNITLVKEAVPIRVEMVVRGFLTGSAWRKYEKGQRNFSGTTIPDGLTKNQRFATPILTPTTKENSDREITPIQIAASELATKQIYDEMAQISLRLFDFGSKYLAERGIILVDSKYEFGLIGDKIILIDEIHTPDSSRFWRTDDYEKNSESVDSMDKEYVRAWLMENKIGDVFPSTLPRQVVDETRQRYIDIFRRITDKDFTITTEDSKTRIYRNLCRAKIIKQGYVALIMGSVNDLVHSKKIAEIIEKYDIMADMRVLSAHKNSERIPEIAAEYNASIEPGSVIAIAGRSNGLGGALAANLNIPVFNCPPFHDRSDFFANINSSLMMPSKTPAATVIDHENAALAALRSLNLPALRSIFNDEIAEMKSNLYESDIKIRGKK